MQNFAKLKFDVPKVVLNDDILKDKKFIKSCDQIMSVISLTNWYDEVLDGGAIGLVFQTNVTKFEKMGYELSFDHKNITSTLLPIKDYLDVVYNFFGNGNVTNLNDKNILYGNAVGNGNSMIPLYINRFHWKIARSYLEPLLGLTYAHNPSGYTKQHVKNVFLLCLEMAVWNFLPDRSDGTLQKHRSINDKWIQSFFYIWRTCVQLMKEQGYSRGIKKYIDNFMLDPKRRLTKGIYDSITILSQLLCSEYELNEENETQLLTFILEEGIRRYMTKVYKPSHLNVVLENEETLLAFKCEIEKNMIPFLETLDGYIKFSKVFRDFLKKVGSFKILLKKLEDSYGVLESEYIECFKKMILDVSYVGFSENRNTIPEKSIDFEYISTALKLPFPKINILNYLVLGVLYGKNKIKMKHIHDKNIVINADTTVNDIIKYYKK